MLITGTIFNIKMFRTPYKSLFYSEQDLATLSCVINDCSLHAMKLISTTLTNTELFSLKMW